MTVTDDSERCTSGGTSISEVQCERDDLTDVVFNADATVDTEFNAMFADDDDVLFNGGAGDELVDIGVNGMANADTLNGGDGRDDSRPCHHRRHRPEATPATSAAATQIRPRREAGPERHGRQRLRALDTGRHTFTVVATDTARNIDPSLATFSWKVRRPN